MNILVVVAHPDAGSFNRAIADTVVRTARNNGHHVIFHDLYQEHFDPVLPGAEIQKNASVGGEIGRHCAELSSADGIVIVHPNWWGQPPAILKGWIDRVFRPGIAYEFNEGDSGEGIPIALLQAGTAIVFNTSNTPAERETDIFGDPLERLWKNCVFDLCGVKSFFRKTYSVVVTSTPEQREAWLGEIQAMIEQYFPKG